MHHVVSDGWSMGVLVRKWPRSTGRSRGEPSPLPEYIQYADFAAWQREWLTGEVLERQLSYWKQQLQGAPQCWSCRGPAAPPVRVPRRPAWLPSQQN